MEKTEYREISEHILKRLKERGFDDAVVISSKGDSSQIKFANNKIVANKTFTLVDLSIFAALKKRLVSTSIRNLDKEKAEKVIGKLFSYAKLSSPNNEYGGIAEGPFKYKEIEETFDKRLANLNENIVDYAESSINTAKNLGMRRTAGILENSASHVFLITSNNVKAEEEATEIYFSVRTLKEKEESGHMVNVSRVLNKFEPEKVTELAANIANMGRNPQEGTEGKFDVLFEPLAFANLLEHAGNSASIFNVESGLSFFCNKLGRKVASEKVNFYDDGRLKNGLGSSICDAEGVPTQRTCIIKNGFLKTYLHNTSTAKRYKTKTTANAGIIAPQPHNLVLEAGDYSKEELIGKIKKGIYITNIWYTRFNNYTTGDFSTIPRDGAFYIENGKIKYPVKGIRVTSSMLEILNNIDAIGKKQEQIKSWETTVPTITPHVIVKNVSITKPL
nr:hypothetical protein [uncultured archaeon]